MAVPSGSNAEDSLTLSVFSLYSFAVMPVTRLKCRPCDLYLVLSTWSLYQRALRIIDLVPTEDEDMTIKY